MGDNTIIKNKAEFETIATTFLDKIFKPALENNLGDIEIRIFPNGQRPEQYFCQTAKEAAEIAFNLCNSGIDVYFGEEQSIKANSIMNANTFAILEILLYPDKKRIRFVKGLLLRNRQK